MRKLVVFLKVVFLNEIPEDTTRYESAFSFFNSLSLSLLVERSDADDDYRKMHGSTDRCDETRIRMSQSQVSWREYFFSPNRGEREERYKKFFFFRIRR